MSENLILNMQEALGTNIEKIDINDPNLHTPVHPESSDALAQAAIPAVLIGSLIHLAKQEHPEQYTAQMDQVFAGKSDEVIDAIAKYAQTTPTEAGDYIARTIDAFNRVSQEQHEGNAKKLMSALENQQNDILRYLPSVLGLGPKLNIDIIDDRTNKMEGPLSSLANFFFNENIHPKKQDEREEETPPA
ncbi:hypothetical protein DBR32_11860 [Taibaiella sp. KBW10]|uniref:hypothetical protein n=1 Tax=Taibaiella sp. KBW10 TaxID=2153357 RepID=UPI000F5A0468|nr:hypothetical protein [Taibaiella sp. KBW10]RQO30264.1 hypothetical protein DBR32_11860 [Taibaiella sp. KBW10]